MQGVGTVAVNATSQHDLPVLEGAALYFTIIVVITFVLVDLARAWLNPKLRSLSASPIPSPRAQACQRERLMLALRPARPSATTAFCRFAARCPLATEVCERETPLLVPGPTGAAVACHHVKEALARAIA